jgi:sterol desaturase/sphingolipid hydroxylase (fatty acid hydroxylase superfamily)
VGGRALARLGLLPFAGVNVGFYFTALPLEALLRGAVLPGEEKDCPGAASEGARGPLQLAFWVRPLGYGKSRSARVQAQVPGFWGQLRGSAWNVSGPGAILGAAASAAVLPLLTPPAAGSCPALGEAAWHLAVMSLLGDLCLYMGHRVQHESCYLWAKHHSFHHKILAPTPVGTIFIDPLDMTLQATLPLLVAGWAVGAHPLTFALYCALRVSDNVVNHSGLEGPLVDLLGLKCFPGRATVAHHDAHHRSMVGRGAGNFGEAFWLWDWLFGTLREGGGGRVGASQ